MKQQHGLKSNKLLAAFFSGFLIVSIAYRLWYFFSKDENHTITYLYRYINIVFGLLDDLITGIVLVVFLYFAKKIIYFCFQRRPRITLFLEKCGIVFLYLLLFIITLIYAAHRKVGLILDISFSYRLLMGSLKQGFDSEAIMPYISTVDWIFLLFPFVLLTFLRQFSMQSISFINQKIIIPGICYVSLTAIVFYYMNGWNFFTQRDPDFFPNPVSYVASDFFQTSKNVYARRGDKPSDLQMHAIHLIDPIFSERQSTVFQSMTDQKGSKWNVVLIVLESVGASYVFSDNDMMAMPFLHSLAKNGWYLNDNYTSGNNSLLGMFGIMSGIYQSSAPSRFELRSDIKLPTIATYLGDSYDSFFVQAGYSRMFFPAKLFTNSGYKELYGADTIPIKHKKLFMNAYLYETQTTDFFLSRIAKAKPPFLATYYSGAAHYPYFDYPEYRKMSNIDYVYARYYNNLNLLDQQIKRIYDLLNKKNWLKNTIIIVVGDHGEGFGQHKEQGGWVHGHSLYLDQIKVPVVFYQPALFKPKVIHEATSSIDILPTLLTAMRIPYDYHFFQGESLFQPVQSRKYIFVYNDGGDEIGAINKQNQKMQISFYSGGCRSYDLNSDPVEANPLDCSNKEQEKAIVQFRNYQYSMLSWYNASLVRDPNLGKLKGNISPST